ncbi:MAG: hypothetical protein QHH12_06380 [Candidatus Bathyarchaeota archaeon]|jgi:uncharacterized membrane protein YidH (DUF202 family)|nr:hypothetical protein [Candidatus Bathyarchaeota archaeon A05DMB-3]MDH7607371.1 hypothetical protein [Candidatus Bathyarchaeota archaeon]
MDKAEVVGFFFIALGVALIVHHVLFWQRPFDIADMMHHEFFEAIFFTAGVTLLIAVRSKRGKEAEE